MPDEGRLLTFRLPKVQMRASCSPFDQRSSPVWLRSVAADLDDLGQEGHGEPGHGGVGRTRLQGLSVRPPAPPGTGSARRSSARVRSSFRGPARRRGSRRRRAVSTGPAARAGARWRTRAPCPAIRAGPGPGPAASSATKSGSGELLAMHPGGQLLQRPALHRVLDHLKPGAFLEGDLPQRVLLGRVDRDVPKERRLLWQVGTTGPPGWPRRTPRACGGTANRRPLCRTGDEHR